MVILWLFTISFCIYMSCYAGSNDEDVKTEALFKEFRDRYKRKYDNKDIERNAYMNFVQNVNKVKALNEETKDEYKKTGILKYTLNRYSDQNPEEIQERFGITMKPYDYIRNEKEGIKIAKQRQKRIPIENMTLFDLNETEDLYKEFIHKHRPNSTFARTRPARYYRFYKTLVELNNQIFEGKSVSLNVDADRVKNPNDFYFDGP